jgi:hypothetical protein
MQTIMENPTLIMITPLNSNMLREKISKGFVIEERNDKFPFAVMSKKRSKKNHNINFIFSCVTLGLYQFDVIKVLFPREKKY